MIVELKTTQEFMNGIENQVYEYIYKAQDLKQEDYIADRVILALHDMITNLAIKLSSEDNRKTEL